MHQVLCGRDELDPSQTRLYRTPIKKAGRPCGWVFHVEGTRPLHCSAVWSADEDRILFYDSGGTRFHEVRLSDGPDPSEAAISAEADISTDADIATAFPRPDPLNSPA